MNHISLFNNLPPETGAAYVVVNYMRTAPTKLHKVLVPYVPVNLISDGLLIEPDCIFVIPSDRDLKIDNGKFRLYPLPKSHGWANVITVFLRSLTTMGMVT